MKKLLRVSLINAFSFFLVSLLLPGVQIQGGFLTFVWVGFVLTIFSYILKPILNLISLPLNLVTLGLFSSFINVIILYILTVLVPSVSISGFTFPGFSAYGFVIPQFDLNTFYAFIVTAFVLSFVTSIVLWLLED